MNEPNDLLTKAATSSFAWLFLIGLAIWGGTVNYLTRIKQGKVKSFSFAELVGEWTISGFTGVLTFYICSEMELSWNMIAFFTGISGHLGGRALFIFESYFKAKIPIGGNLPEPRDDNKDDTQ
ncbi:holin [Alteromonas phage vB_AcoS-R7M]|uniref:Holin n=1 Tax=Alteromonas phage vB_AcoS-R7M TaxID=2729541 RepID=A0A6M3YN57_9CAUD|nr:holin [Alteromonas phage vB_AcoS-R7M]QJI53339.1 holin [Alteromonas phage vB_AcoS-R7M]